MESKMKFTKKKTKGLTGDLVIFTCGDFNVTASLQGVQLSGRSEILPDVPSARFLMEAVGSAFKEHKAMINTKLEIPGMTRKH